MAIPIKRNEDSQSNNAETEAGAPENGQEDVSNEQLNSVEALSEDEILNQNFETRLIPEVWDRMTENFNEAQEAIGNEDYTDDLQNLKDLIWSRHPETDTTEVPDGKTAEAHWNEVFSEESVEALFKDYRQGYREVMVVLHESLTLADTVEDEEVQEKIKEDTLNIVRYLSADEANLQDVEDSFSGSQVAVLKELREEVQRHPAEYGRAFLDENDQPLKDQKFSDRLLVLQKERQNLRHKIFREFYSDIGEAQPWKPQQLVSEGEVNHSEATTFESKTEREYKEEFERKFANWDERVSNTQGHIINTQGYSDYRLGAEQRDERPGLFRKREVDAPQVFFMKTETVRVPSELSNTQPPREVLKKVQVSCSTFCEVKSRGEDMGLMVGESNAEEGYYHQALYTMDSSANSVVKAKELLWRLEAHKEQNGFHMVPVVRGRIGEEKDCWLPLTNAQYNKWYRHLTRTVESFEAQNLSYEKVKNLQEKSAFESRDVETVSQVSVEENDIESINNDPERAWYLAHLQLAALEESFESLDLDSLNDEQKEQQEDFRSLLMQEYATFLSVYGRNSAYERIARENLTAQGINPDEDLDLLRQEILKVTETINYWKQELQRLSVDNLELLSYLKAHPEEIAENLETLKTFFAEYKERLDNFETQMEGDNEVSDEENQEVDSNEPDSEEPGDEGVSTDTSDEEEPSVGEEELSAGEEDEGIHSIV